MRNKISAADKLRKIIREELIAANKSGTNINENYGRVLDDLQKAFDRAVALQQGTSILDEGPIAIWIDLGVRNQFCDENGRIKKTKLP